MKNSNNSCNLNHNQTVDIHQHLYGCLTPQMLYQLGAESYKNNIDRLTWYANIYQKTCGITPDFKEYWNSDHGFEILSRDYLMNESGNFALFQAKFNLSIALLPLSENFEIVLKTITTYQASLGNTYSEYRVPLLDSWSKEEIYQFLQRAFNSTQDLNSDFYPKFRFKLIISMPSNSTRWEEVNECLTHLKNENSCFDKYIAGIDFCYFEEGDDFYKKLDFIKHSSFDCFLHAGETCETYGLLTSYTRIADSLKTPVKRLAHLTTLSYEPHKVPIFKSEFEILQFKKWCKENREYGLSDEVEKQETHENCHILKDLILNKIKSNRILIESCPTSNLRLATYPLTELPANFLINNDVEISVCSDDPGIFNTDIKNEYKVIESYQPGQ